MTDKPFDPVTEGTPKELLRFLSERGGWEPHITARDAAMLAKGEEIGRLKGLEEAAEIIYDKCIPDIVTDESLYKSETVLLCMEAIRAAAETAKEGGE